MKFSRRGIKIYYKSTVSLSPYNTFVESGVLVLATEKGRKDFKESLQLAGEEVAAVGRVVDTVINKQEEDKRNPITVLGEERQAEKWRNEGLVEDFKNAGSQEEMAEAIEKIGAKEGYEVEVIYTDSSNGKLLDGKEGNAWFDENTGKITILINTEAEGIGNKDKLAGVLAEELSHGINEANGKNKGAGTETLAGHSNDYFSGKLGDSNTSLSLIGDGKDYNNVDFGTHVGDQTYINSAGVDIGAITKSSGEIGLGYIYDPNTGKVTQILETSGNVGLKTDIGASVSLNKFFTPYVNDLIQLNGTYFLVTGDAGIPGTKLGVGTGVLIPLDMKTGELNFAKAGVIESASIGVGMSPVTVTFELGNTSAWGIESIIAIPKDARNAFNKTLYTHHPIFKNKARNIVKGILESKEQMEAIKKMYNESRKK